jgi:hypothetical protein
MTNILVCGGRDYYKYSVVWKTLGSVITDCWFKDPNDVITIIQGGASGADFLAKIFALDEYDQIPLIQHKEFPADWKTHGPAAGAIRNQQMLDEGKPDIVVAFPGGSGTADMVRRATKAGVEVLRVK